MPEVARCFPYEQIAAHFRNAITAGELAPGDVLPSTRGLAQEWGVSAPAAARALALLRDEGWIVTRPGKASVVVGVPDDPPDERKP